MDLVAGCSRNLSAVYTTHGFTRVRAHRRARIRYARVHCNRTYETMTCFTLWAAFQPHNSLVVYLFDRSTACDTDGETDSQTQGRIAYNAVCAGVVSHGIFSASLLFSELFKGKPGTTHPRKTFPFRTIFRYRK